MRFYEIAYKNVRGNLYRYVMYYLSNVFSVMLFFIFANFIFHPAIMSLNTSDSTMLFAISKGLEACEYIIIIFSFFFVSYSNSAFIKSRGREFGLLSLFGMTKGQVRKYVAYENIAVSLFSIIVGIVLGGLFSKLFFMMVESVLGTGTVIPFIISPQAVFITLASFFVLFQVISLFSLMRINSRTIVMQLKSAKVPKPVPKFSKGLALLGVLMITAGYLLAWVSSMGIILTMIPILVLTVTGTYFLLNQFSVAAARGLQQNKRIFYKKTNMIVISQLIYKLRDNAKVLFNIAILGAVTLTAAGTLYSLFDITQKQVMDTLPQHISITESRTDSEKFNTTQKVEEVLAKYNLKTTAGYKFEGIKGTWTRENKKASGNLIAISCSGYNTRAKAIGLKPLDLKENKIALIMYYQRIPDPSSISLDIGGKIQSSEVSEMLIGRVLSLSASDYSYVAVLSDSYFNSIKKAVPYDKLLVYNGYDLDNWKASNDAMVELRNSLPEGLKNSLLETVTDYTSMMKSQALTMLIGLFVALLFLIATGSIIYFKLFTELQRDRAEFVSLMKMGMSRNEVKKIINTQMIIIFFLPFVIAASHASFALKTLSDLLKANLVNIGLTVVLVYLLFQVIYYMIINFVYKSQIRTIQ